MTTIDRNGIYTLVRFYESLTANNIGEFHRYYAENAYFKDPFNEVHHVDEICEIFARMFRQVVDPRFVIKEKVGDGNAMFLEWEMSFRMRLWKSQQVQIIHGVSHLRFRDDGKVAYHRDYWDTGEELYAKLPLIGAVARLLRRAVG